MALGFIAGLGQPLVASKGHTGEGISLVVQFHSPHGASGEVASQVKLALKRGESTFAVAGIPGARGFGAATSFNGNVAFSVGPYYYLVGFLAPSAGGATRAQLVAAVQGLYRRVSG